MITILKFIDFFAGAGGFSVALKQAGFALIGFCEIDKFAVRSYMTIHDLQEGDIWYEKDIRTVKPENVPHADIYTAGFPCQDVSVCGAKIGLSGARSGLYYEFIRIIKGKKEKDRPEWLIIENVKHLLGVNRGFDFASVLTQLDEAGYDAEWQVINSKDHGVPQHRERVFIVGHLRNGRRPKILPLAGENLTAIISVIGCINEQNQPCLYGCDCQFPCAEIVHETGELFALKNLIGGSKGDRVYNPDGLSVTIMGNGGGGGAKAGLYCIDQSTTKPKITGFARCIIARINAGQSKRTGQNSAVLIANNIQETKYCFPILTPDRLEKRQNGRRYKGCNEEMFTLTGQDRHGIILCERIMPQLQNTDNIAFGEKDENKISVLSFDNIEIRRLTPRECWRLQGYPDCVFDKVAAVNSDAQLYKQAGNGITIIIAYEIGLKIKEAIENG